MLSSLDCLNGLLVVKKTRISAIVSIVTLFIASPAVAGLPVVEAVKVVSLGGDSWRVDVTVSHADSGWDHYANGWRVLDAEGNELGFRVLAHPHEQEQPFTRGLTLRIPDTVEVISVQAIDLVHGAGEISNEVQIPR